MSSLYNLEPQPTAKCILHTTAGSLTLELFASQCPLASRNFLQHILNGYYTGTIFHRLIPNFIIQGGDPTGTGAGGASSLPSASLSSGATFADEFHSRLKFNRRGLLGMASTGKDENGSQFFLTLGVTKELQGVNTMFGRVEGDTIFNLVRMGEAESGEPGSGNEERPLYPTRITGGEVVVNPFEDMVVQAGPAMSSAGPEDKAGKKKGVKRKAAKGLLSFGGAEDGEEEEGGVALAVKPKFNAKLVDGGAAAVPPTNGAPKPTKRPAPTPQNEDRPRKRRATPSPSPSPPPPTSAAAQPVSTKPTATAAPAQSRSPSPSPSPPPDPQSAQTALERTQAQIAALKASLQRNTAATAPVEGKRQKSALEAMIPSTAMRGRRRKAGTGANGVSVSRDEQRALDSFRAFGKRLEDMGKSAAPATEFSNSNSNPNPKSGTNGIANGATTAAAEADAKRDGENAADAGDDEANLCDLHFVLHCQSCRRWDLDQVEQLDGANGPADEEDDVQGLVAHKLTFERDRLGKDLQWRKAMEKELVVIDPRERERDILGKKREKGRGGKEKGGRER